MNKINIELITGIFVIIGIACFTWLAVSVAGATFTEQPGYSLSARFTSISGLRDGAIVEGAGVRIGTVTAIDFDPDAFEAIVHLRINEGVPIQEDAIASIRTQGIIGEKYINIVPGGFDELLTEGMEIYETESSISLEELVSRYIFSSDD
ncbi:MAG: outer membrane lipid asymmetry maintenance protein MlaD [Gammaproteobacteria bacterium]|jgi:phospholipid/cholesterol/gamma-HCH transport system substrate-binding protein|nr:outer membrane lipid asymmetry maintenance protein MlaD [Gammaproteobacteria bacterium]MBT6044058.1 outer membrane lipid asymmetry maintenance protein MlaD [Gammaproteobacteria bacterium]